MSRRKKSMFNPNLYVVVLLALVVAGNYFVQRMGIDSSDIFMEEIRQLDFSNPVLYLPAVDQEGVGVLATLVVEAKDGDGKELINIDKLVFWEDTQQSIQIAKKVACELTGMEEDSVDVTYSISSENATVVGGPSAGAALAVATVAALEGRDLDSSVIITGTIAEDGSIGTVGGIAEKARASQENGARLFLIPEGTATHSIIEPERKCVEHPHFVYCETVYKKVEISVSEGIDIPVIEVGTVEEALEYFFIEEV